MIFYSREDSYLEFYFPERTVKSISDEEEHTLLGDKDVQLERKRVLEDLKDDVKDSLIVVSSIVKNFRSVDDRKKVFTVVNRSSFAVEEGICFGLLGPNGKSVLRFDFD